MNQRLRPFLLGTSGLVLVVVCWQLAAASARSPFFPPPTEIIEYTLAFWPSELGRESILISLRNLSIGLLIGIVSGVVVGVILGRIAWAMLRAFCCLLECCL